MRLSFQLRHPNKKTSNILTGSQITPSLLVGVLLLWRRQLGWRARLCLLGPCGSLVAQPATSSPCCPCSTTSPGLSALCTQSRHRRVALVLDSRQLPGPSTGLTTHLMPSTSARNCNSTTASSMLFTLLFIPIICRLFSQQELDNILCWSTYALLCQLIKMTEGNLSSVSVEDKIPLQSLSAFVLAILKCHIIITQFHNKQCGSISVGQIYAKQDELVLHLPMPIFNLVCWKYFQIIFQKDIVEKC